MSGRTVTRFGDTFYKQREGVAPSSDRAKFWPLELPQEIKTLREPAATPARGREVR